LISGTSNTILNHVCPLFTPLLPCAPSPTILILASRTVVVYTLAHDLQPGKFRPTLTHSFVRLIHEKGLLLACFTQNIDTLERRAGVPESKLIEAHGSFATHHCIKCRAEYDHESMMDAVEQKKIPRCRKCQGYVKPDIVFFGEAVGTPRFHTLLLTSENPSCQINSGHRAAA
jgi:NAD-dependent SIR2 family protein deacetylase